MVFKQTKKIGNLDFLEPKSTLDIIGNKSQVDQIKKFLKNFHSNLKDFNNKKALIIIGNPGIGKTTTVRLVAKELGYAIVE